MSKVIVEKRYGFLGLLKTIVVLAIGLVIGYYFCQITEKTSICDGQQSEQQAEIVENSADPDRTTCEKIEYVLSARLNCPEATEKCVTVFHHIENAKIYVNLSERGCASNVGKYKALAKQELEIAQALNEIEGNVVNPDIEELEKIISE